jgi:hypothetical protein
MYIYTNDWFRPFRGVIAGLVPAIHPIEPTLLIVRWMRGSGPRMTSHHIVPPA